MKGGSAFLVGVIIGLVVMFGLVKQGYVRVANAPSPSGTVVVGETPSPAESSAPVASAEPAASSEPAPAATGAQAPSASPVAGQTYAWTGTQGTITYAFHGDATYDATYTGTEGDTHIVGVSKGTYSLSGSDLSTHEASGATRRTANGTTSTRPEGAGNVTFTVGDGTLRDSKGRTFTPIR
ncbi:hypothetical protein EPN44_13095 [bacterium]|nr:MAG: hypothetical protein EPN44_13095 [bacterium]